MLKKMKNEPKWSYNFFYRNWHAVFQCVLTAVPQCCVIRTNVRQPSVRGGAMWPVWLTLVTSVKCPLLTLATNQSPVMVSTKMRHQSLTGVGRKEFIKRNKTYHNCSLKCTCYTFAKNCQVILSTISDFVYFAKLMHIWAINFTLKRLFCWLFALHSWFLFLPFSKQMCSKDTNFHVTKQTGMR